MLDSQSSLILTYGFTTLYDEFDQDVLKAKAANVILKGVPGSYDSMSFNATLSGHPKDVLAYFITSGYCDLHENSGAVNFSKEIFDSVLAGAIWA